MPAHVVVPWRPGAPDRARAWSWVRDQYLTNHPSWPVTLAECPPGPWCKAAAVMPAVRACPAGSVVVVADADVWSSNLAGAVDAVRAGADWATPHRVVHRLTEHATEQLIAGERGSLDTIERPYVGVIGGGVMIARRETLLAVPLDHRFKGWGGEDLSWGIALQVLSSDWYRGKSPLLHLWHEPQPRRSRRHGSQANTDLSCRYHHAARDPELMRALIQEVTSP